MIHTLTTANYNSRKRNPGVTTAFIVDAHGDTVNAIKPGKCTHKQAIEWAEWRAETIREDYPGAARLVVYVDDIDIGEIKLPSPRYCDRPERTPMSAGFIPENASAEDKVTGYIIGVICGWCCNARELYGLCNAARAAWDIARALDGGTLDDIRREIISYIYLTTTDSILRQLCCSRDDVNKAINKIDWLNE